jgi:hypothetical protein
MTYVPCSVAKSCHISHLTSRNEAFLFFGEFYRLNYGITANSTFLFLAVPISPGNVGEVRSKAKKNQKLPGQR